MTLVELVFATALFSTLLASTAGLIRSGLHAQVMWGDSVKPAQQLEQAFNRLEQDLASAQPFFGVPFVGESGRVELARVESRSVDGELPAPEWLRVVYHLEPDGDSMVLWREEFVWRRQAAESSPLRREAIMRLVSGTFAFGAQDAQQQLVWTDAWTGKLNELPRLVTFTCDLPLKGGQPPLTLTRAMRNPAGILPIPEEP